MSQQQGEFVSDTRMNLQPRVAACKYGYPFSHPATAVLIQRDDFIDDGAVAACAFGLTAIADATGCL